GWAREKSARVSLGSSAFSLTKGEAPGIWAVWSCEQLLILSCVMQGGVRASFHPVYHVALLGHHRHDRHRLRRYHASHRSVAAWALDPVGICSLCERVDRYRDLSLHVRH